MKAIRTREESLDAIKRKRRDVANKADSAEKKLAKMSGEHKGLQAQTELLQRLRDEMRSLDGEILHEEADVQDFKRKAARNFLLLKFGGILEFAEKATVSLWVSCILESNDPNLDHRGIGEGFG